MLEWKMRIVMNSFKRALSFSFNPFSLLFLLAGFCPAASEETDVSEALFHHVLNGKELELFPFLPPIQLPHGFTVHQFMLVLSSVIIFALFALAASKGSLKPGKLLISVEAIILFIRDDVVYPVMGEEKGQKWLSFFTSLFIYLLTVNFLGLIPAFKTATGNINVTAALAVIIFLLTFIVGFKEVGFLGFFKNLYPQGAPVVVGIFVFILELLSIFTRSMVLSLRLFANMFAGHLAILSFLVLIFVINPFFGFVSVPFAVFTYTLEALVAFLQAYVFTLLSCIFIGMASTH